MPGLQVHTTTWGFMASRDGTQDFLCSTNQTTPQPLKRRILKQNNRAIYFLVKVCGSKYKLDVGLLYFSDCHQPKWWNLGVTKLSENSAGKQVFFLFCYLRSNIYSEIWLFFVLAGRKYAQLPAIVCILAAHYVNKLQLCSHMWAFWFQHVSISLLATVAVYFIFFIVRHHCSFCKCS